MTAVEQGDADVKGVVSFVIGAVMLLAAPPAAAWEQRDQARVFFFGNSLIYHVAEDQTTAVPYWLGLLAQHAGKELALDGRFGFPRNFAAELPPSTNWDFKDVKRISPLWSPIKAESYDTYILSTENFIQGRAPGELYLGENNESQSPLGATLAVLDWTRASAGSRFLVYEGWPGFHPDDGPFPPDATTFAHYYDYALGVYHDWYVGFVDALRDARSRHQIDLIPVTPVMAAVLQMPELADIPSEALYLDTAPHGTATIYLLAAMITWSALYGERPPAGFSVPDVIASDFAHNYEAIADVVWREMQAADAR